MPEFRTVLDNPDPSVKLCDELNCSSDILRSLVKSPSIVERAGEVQLHPLALVLSIRMFQRANERAERTIESSWAMRGADTHRKGGSTPNMVRIRTRTLVFCTRTLVFLDATRRTYGRIDPVSH